MNKVFAFIIIFPLIAILFFKGVAFYEYDTKQRYIKDLIDDAAYKVKITGVLNADELDGLKTKLGGLGKFEAADSIVLKYGTYSYGSLSGMTDYMPGEVLNKGDAFLIYVKSSGVSNYSRLQNGGINPDDSQNIYYKAKAVVRVERID